jgi:hypothetical protein
MKRPCPNLQTANAFRCEFSLSIIGAMENILTILVIYVSFGGVAKTQ